MNIAKIIKIANLKYGDNIITDKTGRRIVNNIIEVFNEVSKKIDYDVILDEGLKKFYNVFLKPALNGEKKLIHTHIYFSLHFYL